MDDILQGVKSRCQSSKSHLQVWFNWNHSDMTVRNGIELNKAPLRTDLIMSLEKPETSTTAENRCRFLQVLVAAITQNFMTISRNY